MDKSKFYVLNRQITANKSTSFFNIPVKGILK